MLTESLAIVVEMWFRVVPGPVLREMRERRGYTNDQLLAVLREKGVEIGKSTLNDYLRTKRRPATSPRPTDEKAPGELARDQNLTATPPAVGGPGPDTKTKLQGPRVPAGTAASSAVRESVPAPVRSPS